VSRSFTLVLSGQWHNLIHIHFDDNGIISCTILLYWYWNINDFQQPNIKNYYKILKTIVAFNGTAFRFDMIVVFPFLLKMQNLKGIWVNCSWFCDWRNQDWAKFCKAKILPTSCDTTSRKVEHFGLKQKFIFSKSKSNLCYTCLIGLLFQDFWVLRVSDAHTSGAAVASPPSRWQMCGRIDLHTSHKWTGNLVITCAIWPVFKKEGWTF